MFILPGSVASSASLCWRGSYSQAIILSYWVLSFLLLARNFIWWVIYIISWVLLPHGCHPDFFFLKQTKYALDLLKKAAMLYCKPMSTPLFTGTKLLLDSGTLFSYSYFYRSLVGGLQYLTLAQFFHTPKGWEAGIGFPGGPKGKKPPFPSEEVSHLFFLWIVFLVWGGKTRFGSFLSFRSSVLLGFGGGGCWTGSNQTNWQQCFRDWIDSISKASIALWLLKVKWRHQKPHKQMNFRPWLKGYKPRAWSALQNIGWNNKSRWSIGSWKKTAQHNKPLNHVRDCSPIMSLTCALRRFWPIWQSWLNGTLVLLSSEMSIPGFYSLAFPYPSNLDLLSLHCQSDLE